MKRKDGKLSRKLVSVLSVIVMVLPGISAVSAAEIAPAAEQEEGFTHGEGNRAEYMGFKHYKGHLHSHTSLSDGIEFPSDAYEHVKEHTDLDFFSVTEHDVTYQFSTGNDYLTDYNDYLAEDYKILIEQSNEHNQDHEFVAIPGTEVTWYDKVGGHINLFNAEWFPRSYGKGATGLYGWGNLKYDLTTFYARLVQDPDAIAQFNHPGAARHGNFDDFGHYNQEVDHNISLFEYRYDSNYPDIFEDYVLSLDKGWHVSPAYSADEHNGNWGNVAPYVTGVWAEELTREGIYDAMRNSRTYTSADRNFELAFSANGHIMGSILSAETTEIDISIVLNDPDPQDEIDKVLVYSNNGQVIKEYTDINSNATVIEDTLPSADGDYFFIRVYQKDGDHMISAPIWIGEVTRGTDFAPDIEINGEIPEQVELNETVVIPGATATDDSGETPEVQVTVFDSKGEVELTGNQFTIEEYGEYFIKYYATDSNGNRRVELKRILVEDDNLDAEKILSEFSPIVNVGQTEDEVGTNLVTDRVLGEAYVQYKLAADDWDQAQQVETDVFHFEIAYGDSIAESNYRILASHEATLSGLEPGSAYHFRYGLTPDGPWGDVHTFETASTSGETVMYVLGDLEATEQKPDDFQRFGQMLDVLQTKNPDGRLMIQTGNLVDTADHIQPWEDIFAHALDGVNLISAHVVGELEEYTRKERIETFKGFYNLPKNGMESLSESNYSFDYGDVHVAVLNSLADLDEQLAWLDEDMRATEKIWRVVVGHYPYYGGEHSDQPSMDLDRAKVSNKFKELGIALHIGGQDHIYKRTTIRNGVKTEDVNSGTTFITAGTTGSQFYENKEFEWDHIVYDDELQTGILLEADDEALTVKAYNINGDEIDAFTIQPDMLDITRFAIEDNAFQGIGLLNYSSVESVAVIGEKWDYAGEELLETQVKEVPLNRFGREQLILFDAPIHFAEENTVTVSVYDNLTDQNQLIPRTIVKEGMVGDGSAANPFRIKSVEGLNKMHEFLDSHFVLEKDIVGDGEIFTAIGANGAPFTGTFDGNGHTISGLIISSGGAGIFAVNDGVIKNIGVVNAHMDVVYSNVGLLVDLNNGTVENSYSTGSIRGDVTAGGLVGYSNGIVRNSYSTADVSALRSQAGGVIGITNKDSQTENVYSTGTIKANNYNAAGITAYGYNNTVVRNSIALNLSVTAANSANRVVGQVATNQQAILENNYAFADMYVDVEGVKQDSPTTRRGMGLSKAEIEDPDTYTELLGWDFDSVWVWDDQEKRPVLQVFEEDEEPVVPVEPIEPSIEVMIAEYVEDSQLNAALGDQLLYRISIIHLLVEQQQISTAIAYLNDLRSYIGAPAVIQQGLITEESLNAIDAEAQAWMDQLQN